MAGLQWSANSPQLSIRSKACSRPTSSTYSLYRLSYPKLRTHRREVMGSTPPHTLPCTPHRERPLLVHTKLVHHTSENHPTRLTRCTRLSVQDHPVTSHTSFLPPHKLSGIVSLVEVSLHLVLYLHYDIQLLRSLMCGGEAYPSNCLCLLLGGSAFRVLV